MIQSERGALPGLQAIEKWAYTYEITVLLMMKENVSKKIANFKLWVVIDKSG